VGGTGAGGDTALQHVGRRRDLDHGDIGVALAGGGDDLARDVADGRAALIDGVVDDGGNAVVVAVRRPGEGQAASRCDGPEGGLVGLDIVLGGRGRTGDDAAGE